LAHLLSGSCQPVDRASGSAQRTRMKPSLLSSLR
jgi:hypothetical protein